MAMVNSSGRQMNSSSRGFTLVEVMVALVVFAVVSVALVRNTTMSLRQAGILEDRTIAWWLAENEMTALRMRQRSDENFPAVGTDTEFIETGNAEWEVSARIESTENDWVRRVVVSVYKDGRETPSAELIGFLGRY